METYLGSSPVFASAQAYAGQFLNTIQQTVG